MLFWVYQLLFPFVGFGVILKLALGGRGAALKESPRQIRQRLGLLEPAELAGLNSENGVVWVHAASVGEVNAAAPLIEALLTSPCAPKVLLTTSTVAGQRRASQLPFHPDMSVLAPMDFYPCVLAFLRRTRPYALVVIETELWPAMLRAVSRSGARIAIANGRVSARAFARYRWIGSMMRPLLARVSRAAVQTAEDAARFAALGVPQPALRTVGNLKNDLAPAGSDERERARDCLDDLGWAGYPVWVAGSTWPDEEQTLLDAFLKILPEFPMLRLVLAPRHMERCAETQRLLARLGIRYAVYSSRQALSEKFRSPTVLLVDELGRLRGFYSACDVAFVGGTLNRVGGHNLLEPAIASKPVIFGPCTDSVQEQARTLEYGGGGFRAADAEQLAAALRKLLSDPREREQAGRRAAQAAKTVGGATRKAWEFLSPFFFPDPASS